MRVARNPNQGFSAVGSENTGKQTWLNPLFNAFRTIKTQAVLTWFSGCPSSTKGWRPFRTLQPWNKTELLQFGLGASFFQLLLGSFSVGLRHTFFDRLGCAVHQVFGFFQAQTCDFAHGLDHGHFVSASFDQNEVEVGLLFSGSTTGSCLLYTSPSPRDRQKSRMPSSA